MKPSSTNGIGTRRVQGTRTAATTSSAKLQARRLRLTAAAFLYIFVSACGSVSPPRSSDIASAPVHRYDDHAILWKIRRENTEPNYLLGTIHTEEPWAMEIPEPILNALSESDTFIMEVFPEDLNTPDLQMLTSALHTKLDGRLLLLAASEGKRVSGLESVEAQLRLLSLPELQYDECIAEAREDEILVAAESDESFLNAYLARNLTTILGLREQLLERLAQCASGGNAKHLRRQLFTERNQIMFERMVPKLQQGNTFIAIGVGHLPGREGLLELLERSGYQIAPVY